MYKISKIISLPIISLYESEYQGTIYNIVFDCKSQKCKFIYLLNEDDNVEKIINFSDIYTIGKHCLFIKNNSCLNLKSNYDYILNNLTSLINLPVYNMKGDNIGTTKDIELDEKFDLQNIILSNGTSIPRTQIINFGKTTILVNDIIVNIAKFKPKLKTIKPYNCPSKVIILKDKQMHNNEDVKRKTLTPNQNNKIITDYKFLINRIISQDILSYNGEVIAKKGSYIDKSIVNKASLYGKLIELARYSKKN